MWVRINKWLCILIFGTNQKQSKAIKNSEFMTIHLWPYSDPTIVQQKPQSQAGEFLTCIYQHPRRCVYMYPLVFLKFCFYHRCILNTFTMLSTWFSGCHRLPRDWRTIWRQSGSLWSRGVVTSEVWKLKAEQDSGKWQECSIFFIFYYYYFLFKHIWALHLLQEPLAHQGSSHKFTIDTRLILKKKAKSYNTNLYKRTNK